MTLASRLAARAVASRAGEALRLPDYRRLWLAQSGSSFALNFWFIGAAWLVLGLTDSALAVGAIGACAAVPSLLLSLVGGALADRIDRRALLLGALAAWGALAAAAGALASTGSVEAWHVLALAAGIGLADAASNPAWHTLVVEYAGKSRLLAANALGQLGEFAGEVVAPVPAGLLIAGFGAGPAFFVAAALCAAATLPLARVRSSRRAREALEEGPESAGLLSQIRGGLAYTLRTPPFPGLLGVSATSILSATAYPLVPVYARDELGVGPEGYGLMSAALAAGMVAGALVMAARGDVGRRGRALLASRLGWFVAMAAFAVSDAYVLSLALLFAMGLGGAVSANLLLTQFQARAEDRMRGRVMGIVRITESFDPLGAALGGGLAVALGNERALLAAAFAGVAVLGAIVALSPSTWRE